MAGPGESVVVPRDTVHTWWNAGREPSRVRVTVTPGGRFAEMIAAVWGLGALGRTDRRGRPKLLDAAVLAAAFGDEVVFVSPPPWAQRLLARVAPVARALGRRADDPAVLAAAVGSERWPA